MALYIWDPNITLDANDPDKLGCPFISGLDRLLDPRYLIYYPCIKHKCRLWDEEALECSIKVRMQALRHIHQEHLHVKEHPCADGLEMDCGAQEDSHGVLKAAILVAEAMGNADLDHNNLIYCKDFIIDPTDPRIPPMLVVEQEKLTCQGITNTMTWNQYLNSL